MLHFIKLSWNPSPDPVDGYNVYRSEISGGESSPAIMPLNSAPISATSYEDDTIQVGHKYYYEVRAVAGPVQSVVSNEVVSAVIVPFPPTDLAVTEAQ